MTRACRWSIPLAALGLGLALVPVASAQPAPDGLASLGVLMPVFPPDRSIITGAMKAVKTQTFGPFTYQTGTIDGVPVVVNVAPGKGPIVRSLAALDMMHHYRIAALLYPGTSGAHLPPSQMRVGDIVLGAANVDFGSFLMTKDGDIHRHEAAPDPSDPRSFGTFYLDPRLLARLACAAWRTAAKTQLPPELNPDFPRLRPDVFYYGVQGTSSMWLANSDFIGKLSRTFGEIDEDGDWDSNMVAVLNKVPFIEVSGISDSILEFPATKLGVGPAAPNKSPGQAAQDIANEVLLDLIRHDGAAIIAGGFTTDATQPFAGEDFSAPKQPGALLKNGKCQ